MRPSRYAAAALACCLAAAPVAAGDAGHEELAVQFLTGRFLEAVAEAQEQARIETERFAGTYLAERTGLLWARTDNGTDLDWYAARDHCRALQLGGWSDWRLPTIDELEQLHERRSQATYKVPAGIQLSACCPWSATAAGESSAWNFSFQFRKRFSGSRNYSYGLRALCLRTPTAEQVAWLEAKAEEAAAAAAEQAK